MTNTDARLHDPTYLLEQDACLRALARRLVHDAALAEDVAQETWLHVLRDPRRVERLGGWLSGVARLVAFGKRRENTRRARRESQSEPPSPAPSTEELLARETARRAVVDAVMQLAEPARAVVVLRFFDDLPPRTIAARLGVPVETVRTRIKRALEQLRRELDQRHGGDGRAWCAVLAPIVVAKKAAAGTLAIASIAAALVVGTLGVFTWNDDRVYETPEVLVSAASPDVAHVSAAVAVADAEAPRADAVREAVVAMATPASAPSSAAPPRALNPSDRRGDVIVTVVDAVTAAPLPHVDVVLATCPFGHERKMEFGGQDVLAEGTTDHAGQARLNAAAGIEVLASLHHSDYDHVFISLGDGSFPPRRENLLLAEPEFVTPDGNSVREIVLRAHRSGQLTGRVETEDGKPLVEEFVLIDECHADGTRVRNLANDRTDANGTYSITGFRVTAGSTYELNVVADGYSQPKSRAVTPLAGIRVDVPTIVMHPRGVPITGTIVGDVFAVEGKKLELHGEPFGFRDVVLGADGTFEFRVWFPNDRGSRDFRLEFDGYCLDGRGVIEFSVPKNAQRHDLGIIRASAPSTHYTGRVLRTDGMPATSGHVRLGDFSSQIAPDGTFHLVLCSPGPLPLDVWWSSGEPHSNEQLESYTFAATTDNILRVQPRGVLVRIVRGGELEGFDGRFEIIVRGTDLELKNDGMRSMPAQWRALPDLPFSQGKAGPATVRLRIDGKPAVTKDITLGEGGLLGPEVVVTFDHAELGLE